MEPTIIQTQVQTTAPTSIQKNSIWKIIKDSCKKICFHWKPLFFLTIPAMLLSIAVFIISILTYLKCVGASLDSVMREVAMSLILYGSVEFSVAPQGAQQVTYFLFIFAVAICVQAYIVGRLTSSVIKVLQSAEKKTIWSAFKEGGQGVRVLKIIGLLLLAGIIISFSTLFFVIPGVFYVLGFSLALFYLILEQQGIKKALYSSLSGTRGNKWKMLVLAVFTVVLSFITGVVCGFVVEVVAKIAQHAGMPATAHVIQGLGIILVFVLTAATQYLYTIAILSQVYASTKQVPENSTPVRIWPVILFPILGFCIYIFMLVILPIVTHSAITSARAKATQAYQMQKDLEQKMKDEGVSDSAVELTPYEKELQALFNKDIATIRPGNKGDGEVIGMGLDFNYPNTWINLGAPKSGKEFMQFMRMSQASSGANLASQPSKANDLFRGGVAFAYTYDTKSKLVNGYQFLKTYATPKLESEKKNGDILSYSITAYPGKTDVGVLESKWKQNSAVDKTKEITVHERYYYWFVGPHRYTIHAVDDEADFLETDKAARVMINSMQFDDLITKYATEGK